jgi:hypothetical protein
MRWNNWIGRAGFLVLPLLTACTTIGPGTMQRDRFDYSSAVAESWKQQALLNIVKIRYGESPVFVDVANIVAGYSMQTGVSVNGVASSHGTVQGDYAAIGGQAVYTERPTITYTPLTGQQYMRGIMTPIAPSSVLFLLQAGYAADSIMFMTVESINGLNNRSVSPARANPGNPEYFQVVEIMRKVQRSGEIGMRVEVEKTKKETTLMTFHRHATNGGLDAERAELRRLLNLDPNVDEYKVSYGMGAGGGTGIEMTTRSILQIMLELSGTVEIPKAHLDDGGVYPAPPLTEESRPLMRVRSGTEPPKEPFVAVRYQGYWFWIDRSDLRSKRAFSFLTAIFNFADLGKAENLPLVTIPTQ